MSANSGKSYQISFKEQSVIGTPVSGAGAFSFTTLPSSGPTFSRTYIESNEDRADGQSGQSRLGVRSVSGEYSSELKVGAHNPLWEAVLRGSFGSSPEEIDPGTTRRAYTVEQYLKDIDETFRMEWLRWTGFRVSCPSDGMATVGFPFFARNGQRVAAGSTTPIFPSPTIVEAQSLVSLDGTVMVNGSPVVGFTAIDFAGTRGGGVQSEIGTDLSADVYDGRLKITGNASMTVRDLSFLDYISDEDVVQLGLTMSDPAGNSMAITLGGVVFGNYAAPVGQDNAMVASTSFTAGFDESLGGMIHILNTYAS